MATKKVKGKDSAVKKSEKPDKNNTITIANKVVQNIVNGQLTAQNNTKYKKSIREIIGENYSPYEQKTTQEYQDYIDSLNLADIESHARSLSIPTSYDREIMEKRLVNEFNLRNSEYYANSVTQPIKNNKKLSPEILRILSEGR